MRRPRLKPHFAPPFEPVHGASGEVTVRVFGYRQTRSYSCGFATVLMILRTFGRAIEARTLFQSLGTGRSGTRQRAIVRELRRAQISANVRYDVDFETLVRAFDAAKLVVGYLADVEHWLVLYGYGRRPDRLFVADPRPGESCEHLWGDYGPRLGGFGIVCSPREPERVTDSFGDADSATIATLGAEPERPALPPTGCAPLQLSLPFSR